MDSKIIFFGGMGALPRGAFFECRWGCHSSLFHGRDGLAPFSSIVHGQLFHYRDKLKARTEFVGFLAGKFPIRRHEVGLKQVFPRVRK